MSLSVTLEKYKTKTASEYPFTDKNWQGIKPRAFVNPGPNFIYTTEDIPPTITKKP